MVQYGFTNTAIAVLVVSVIIFLTGLPIAYYAARYGVDIDLLSRGAGFGYIGSTITSLIYASFTFIFFALEAAILASALELLTGLPLSIGYLLSSLIIIPLSIHGITLISRFQLWTQPAWILLQMLPFIFIFYKDMSTFEAWVSHTGSAPVAGEDFNWLAFGAASGVLFSLIAQIGEQVDYLRFLPPGTRENKPYWWLSMIAGGPGWIIVGALKILAGSFLAVLAINHGISASVASDPIHMYLVAFSYVSQSPTAALALAGIFVILCQLKINVTNSYAGSIAWSNFFSRLTHSHPGRVVWLVFNVVIAVLLMKLGIYHALENILGIYSIVAVAWVCSLSVDLLINKPLGLSPAYIEFKRAHLFDINPVGIGAMSIATLFGILGYTEVFGPAVKAFSSYITMLIAFLAAPAIAWMTRGRYYIARPPTDDFAHTAEAACEVCGNLFETEDMTTCPAYQGSICSLCCSLDSLCNDRCKVGARVSDQLAAFGRFLLPGGQIGRINSRLLQFLSLMSVLSAFVAAVFWLVSQQMGSDNTEVSQLVNNALFNVYMLLLILIGVLVWLFVLAEESKKLALDETTKQADLLTNEILAHNVTGMELQKAKENADAANQAKSRYLTGISHELRSPLNSILGYAQLLEKDGSLSDAQQKKINLIRRSSDHLANLIEGLLDISSIEAGRLEMHRDQVSLGTLLKEIIDMSRVQAAAKGLDFETVSLSELPEVITTDEKHLRQILINLLSNAIKYTEQGVITFTVRYRSEVADFYIRDTGIGIESDYLETIFHPFERIRKPGMPQNPGTGLGLTISRFLAEIMGGNLSVKSSPGEGSEFRLSLMLPRVFRVSELPQPTRYIKGYKGIERTVMVVDDNASHRGLISEILSPVGFEVLEAKDGYECLEAVGRYRIHLFLLDISMPVIDGWELLERLRREGVNQPVLMVSADAIDGPTHAMGPEPKFRPHDGFIAKPIRDNNLLDKVSTALDLEWEYMDDNSESKRDIRKCEVSLDFSNSECRNDCRELLSMSELGYIAGMERVLQRIEARSVAPEFVECVRRHMSELQISRVTELCRRIISHAQ